MPFKPQEHPRDERGQFTGGGGPHDATHYFRSNKGRMDRITSYTGPAHRDMNHALRLGSFRAADEKFGARRAAHLRAMAFRLNQDLEGAPRSPGLTHRGAFMPASMVRDMAESSHMYTNGFWSTSSHEHIASGFLHPDNGRVGHVPVMMHVTHKSGVDISGVSAGPREAEVLLRPAIKLRVDRHDERGGVHHFHLTEVD